MLDLGTSLLASVARDPSALAIVDGAVRLSYAAWYRRISRHRRAFAAAVLGLATLLGVEAAEAEGYPARPIQVIVPFAGGSASDVVTRIVLDRMGTALGQRFVVDNRPGAGGNIGTA